MERGEQGAWRSVAAMTNGRKGNWGGESRSGAAKWKDVGSGGDAWREGGWPMGCVGRLARLSRKGNEFSIFNFLSK
jgi:hypothetical protein